MDVSSFRSDVKPFALKGQVAVGDSATGGDKGRCVGWEGASFSLSHDSIASKSHPLVPNHAARRVSEI